MILNKIMLYNEFVHLFLSNFAINTIIYPHLQSNIILIILSQIVIIILTNDLVCNLFKINK